MRVGPNVGVFYRRDRTTLSRVDDFIVVSEERLWPRDANRFVVDYIDDKPVRIAGPQTFLAHYDEIVNPAERCAITTVKDSDVWANSHGYTIDRGALWWEKSASRNDTKPGQEIDWTKIAFKIQSFNNVNVMTQA